MIYLNKNIITIQEGVIAHGVNCTGAMNSGVAKAIREKWPEVYRFYRSCPTGKRVLGMAFEVQVAPSLYVINCYTQVFYGHNGRFANLKAVEHSVQQAYNYADYHHLPLYMPKIGCGRGGLSWEQEVEPVINELDESYSRVDTYICEWKE